MRIWSFLGILLVTRVTTGCVTRVHGEAHAEPARVRVVHQPARVRVVTRAAPARVHVVTRAAPARVHVVTRAEPVRVHVVTRVKPPPPPQVRVHVEAHAKLPPPPRVHVEAHAGGSISSGSSGRCPPGHVWSDGKCHSTGKGNDPKHHKK
jgi:hypothetical protein